MHDVTIIAMSGRKCAGKNETGKFIRQYYQTLFDSTGDSCIECSFADNLKNFCIETLGLRHEQCYGSDDDKETPSEYSWESVSPYLRWKFGGKEVAVAMNDGEAIGEVQEGTDSLFDVFCKLYGNDNDRDALRGFREGKMTGRDIMQLFGTELIRETFGNVWAAATIRRINNSGKKLAVITDNRFPNEVEAVLKEPNGYVIRLTRTPFGTEDQHPSEASLDGFNWNKPNCFVVDNKDMTIDEQNKALEPIIQKIFNR